MRTAADPDMDRTAKARIRDAALERFGRDGVEATSLRSIAEDAGVSAALVIHHFGSKDALRRACDSHVSELWRTQVFGIRDGEVAPEATMQSWIPLLRDELPTEAIMRYLARALLDGSEAGAGLFDDMVAAVTEMLTLGERDGWVQPSDDPHVRAVLLTTFELGPVVLAGHAARHLGRSLYSPEMLLRTTQVLLEVYTHGLLSDDSWLRALDETQGGPA